LTQALSRGWDAHGIEPSPYASSIAKELHGYRIRAEYLHEETYPEESFDAVSLWYVLEHAPDPRSLLETCNRLLKPGGALLVAVPNWSYIRLRRRLVQINKGKPGTVHPHEHLYQYTSGTMKGFIESTGYDFVSEHGASPYMVSGAAINFMKKAAQLLAFGVRAVTGTNLSGILMLGRKKVPS
jgi:SAM-dependent methyltransferase